MKLFKLLIYKVTAFKIIYDMMSFLCVETPLQYPLDCILSWKTENRSVVKA